MTIETIELVAPSEWACYLINADSDSLEEAEIEAVEKWLKAEGVGHCLSCSEESDFRKWHDAANFWPFASNCLTYTFEVSHPHHYLTPSSHQF